MAKKSKKRIMNIPKSWTPPEEERSFLCDSCTHRKDCQDAKIYKRQWCVSYLLEELEAK